MELFSLEVNRLNLVSGLEWWAPLGTRSLSRETRALAKEANAKRFVQMQRGAEARVGFLSKELAPGVPNKLYSIPALLAGMPDIPPYSLLIIEEGEVALLAALQDGLPAPGFDAYGSTAEILAAAKEFISIAPESVMVYGNVAELEAQPLTLDELTRHSKTIKQAQVRDLPNSKAALLVLVLILGAAGWGGNYYYQYKKEQKRLAAERLAHVDVDAKYAENLTTLFRAMTPAKAAYTRLSAPMSLLEVENNGWALASVNCAKLSCTYTWKNDGGTNKSFQAPPGASALAFSDNGDSLTYQLAPGVTLPAGVLSTELPSEQDIRREVVGSFQEYRHLGVSVNFEKAATFGLPPGLPGTPVKLIREGTFTVQGPWYALDVLANLPQASAFDSLEASLGTDQQQINFKATGKYYVK